VDISSLRPLGMITMSLSRRRNPWSWYAAWSWSEADMYFCIRGKRDKSVSGNARIGCGLSVDVRCSSQALCTIAHGSVSNKPTCVRPPPSFHGNSYPLGGGFMTLGLPQRREKQGIISPTIWMCPPSCRRPPGSQLRLRRARSYPPRVRSRPEPPPQAGSGSSKRYHGRSMTP